jgi:hypothetical protein
MSRYTEKQEKKEKDGKCRTEDLKLVEVTINYYFTR